MILYNHGMAPMMIIGKWGNVLDKGNIKLLPTVTVAMAVYKPNIEWFQEQLKSLDDQDYTGNLRLLVFNDSPHDFDPAPYLQQYINNFSWEVIDNGRNNGPIIAFEELTRICETELISYCDQDDVWESNKISQMVSFMEKNPDCTACHCDRILIDENGRELNYERTVYKKTCNELNDVELQKQVILTKNFMNGCAMLMKTSLVKDSLPFPRCKFHDIWLTIYNIFYGRVYCMKDKLMKHRVYGSNTSATLAGISTKDDYYKLKLDSDYEWINFVVDRIDTYGCYDKDLQWVNVRKKYASCANVKNLIGMLSVISIRPAIVLFEIFMPLVPSFLFNNTIKFVRFLADRGVR